MDLMFDGEVITWRGPAPYYFVVVPDEECDQLAAVSAQVSYGWGVIPVTGHIGSTGFTTSLIPKDGGYLLPLKDAVRRPEGIAEADTVTVHLNIGR